MNKLSFLLFVLFFSCHTRQTNLPLPKPTPRAQLKHSELSDYVPQGGSCGALSKVSQSGPLSVLDGRLSLRSLSGATTGAKAYNIMGAPESQEDETRVFYESGDNKFVVMAYELYSKTTDAFEDEAQALIPQLTKEEHQVARLAAESNNVRLVGFFPKTLNTSSEAVWVLGAVVAQPRSERAAFDGLRKPSKRRERRRLHRMGVDLIKSVAPGSKKLDSSAGKRILGEYQIEVPEGWVLSYKPGPDFDVYYLKRLSLLPDAPLEVGIYLGGYASPELEDYTTDKGTLLGSSVEWRYSKSGLYAETMDSFRRGHVHVWIVGKDAAEIAEGRKVAETLQACRLTR